MVAWENADISHTTAALLIENELKNNGFDVSVRTEIKLRNVDFVVDITKWFEMVKPLPKKKSEKEWKLFWIAVARAVGTVSEDLTWRNDECYIEVSGVLIYRLPTWVCVNSLYMEDGEDPVKYILDRIFKVEKEGKNEEAK